MNRRGFIKGSAAVAALPVLAAIPVVAANPFATMDDLNLAASWLYIAIRDRNDPIAQALYVEMGRRVATRH